MPLAASETPFYFPLFNPATPFLLRLHSKTLQAFACSLSPSVSSVAAPLRSTEVALLIVLFSLLKSVIGFRFLSYLGPVSSIQQFLSPGFHLVLRHCSLRPGLPTAHPSFTVPGTHCVDEAGLEPTDTCLPLAPEFRDSRFMPVCLAPCSLPCWILISLPVGLHPCP